MNASRATPLRAICLMGPTAAGKTDIAIGLRQEFPVELVSVDSAQVYRGMDIGTAKPPAEVLAAQPHRLIDICDPWEHYSAGRFCHDAVTAMEEITAANRIPLLVGGTMLYFQCLQRGLADLPEADPELRAQLDARAASEGWPALHAELSKLDPVTAARLNETDAQRIQRALEVCLSAGEPMSELLRTTAPPVRADYLNIALLPADRSILHARIAQRVDRMLAEGFEAEVRALLDLPDISPESPAMRAVGYRQIARYVAGALTLDEAREQAIVATRRLAKRQLTWLRSWPDMHSVDCLAPECGRIVSGIVDSWPIHCPEVVQPPE